MDKVYPKTLVVDVTKEDIKLAKDNYENARAEYNWAHRCPISNAVRRLFPDEDVWTTSVVGFDGTSIRYLNDEIGAYVENVDKNIGTNPQAIKPKRFVLKRFAGW